jgi:hypothetical protein
MKEEIKEGMDFERAYYSSYRIVTNKVSFKDLLDEDHDKGDYTLLVHDPYREVTQNVINELIDYFVETEEYELCAELKTELDKKNNL